MLPGRAKTLSRARQALSVPPHASARAPRSVSTGLKSVQRFFGLLLSNSQKTGSNGMCAYLFVSPAVVDLFWSSAVIFSLTVALFLAKS